MSKNGNLGVLGGGFISAETNKVYTPPQHATSVNGKTLEQLDDGFDDFIEEIVMPSDEPLEALEEQAQAPAEVAETLNETPESPSEASVAKKKSGRKARNTEGLHASVEMIAKKRAIHESEILEITFKSMMEKALLELMCRELLSAYDVHEDSAPALLVKKMTEKSLLEKGRNGLSFSALIEDFFGSLTENKQILLTFEKIQEEQMEAIDKEGHINESMAN